MESITDEYGHGADRIVRVGTYTDPNQLRSRLKQHFVQENKDRSIFRKNIGRCLLNKDKDPYASVWELDFTTRAAKLKNGHLIDPAYQSKIESRVSDYFRYFNFNAGNIIFAAPKIYGAVREPLQLYISELQELFQKKGLNFNFELLCNEDFQEKIFNVVTALSNSVSDTSELFMRSIQMYNLFAEDQQPVGLPKSPVKAKELPADFKGSEVIKIGALVRSSFNRLITNDLITEQEVERLQRGDYSKKTFNINFPVIKKIDHTFSMTEQRNVNGHSRFYADPYEINGTEYLLCNDWYEKPSRSYFEAWLRRIDETK